MKWRFINASVTGTSHLRDNLVCQDASSCTEVDTASGPLLIAVVADGAGSAAKSELAAGRVVTNSTRRMRRWARSRQNQSCVPTVENVQYWVQRANADLKQMAIQLDVDLRELACTLLGVLVSADGTVCFQIGDGAIVVHDAEHGYQVPFWPDHGEYTNTTYFLTDEDHCEHVHIAHFAGDIDAVALFTDGLERLALDFSNRCIHQPFFDPMFNQLVKEPSGRSLHLTKALVTFLDGEAVNARTDDDKSLILAIHP